MNDALTMEQLISETENRFDTGKLEIVYARREGESIYCTMRAPKPYPALTPSDRGTGKQP